MHAGLICLCYPVSVSSRDTFSWEKCQPHLKSPLRDWLIASNPFRKVCVLGDCRAADPAVTKFCVSLWPFARSHGEPGFQEAVTEQEWWLLFSRDLSALVLPCESEAAKERRLVVGSSPYNQGTTTAAVLCGTVSLT